MRSNGSGIRKIMSRQLESYGINILQLHAEWLQANGYKREATSCKLQIRMILKKQQALDKKGLKDYIGWYVKERITENCWRIV